MRKLILFILMLSSLFASAQTVTTISTADSTKFKRTTGTTNAEVIIENGTRNVTGGFLWNRWNGRTQFRLITPEDISGLQDSLTKKANRTFDNVASGAIAKAKADTSANGLLPKSNLFPLGDTRWANTTVVQDSLNTRVKKTGDTMTGTLNGTDIVLSGDLEVDSLRSNGSVVVSNNIVIPNTSGSSTGVIYQNSIPFLHSNAPIGSIALPSSPNFNGSRNFYGGLNIGKFNQDTIGGYKFDGINVQGANIQLVGSNSFENANGNFYTAGIFGGSFNATTNGDHIYGAGTSVFTQDTSAYEMAIVGDGIGNSILGGSYGNAIVSIHTAHTVTTPITRSSVFGMYAAEDFGSDLGIFLGYKAGDGVNTSGAVRIGTSINGMENLINGNLLDSTVNVSSLISSGDSTKQIAQTRWVKQQLANYNNKTASDARYVMVSGNQTIAGNKNFTQSMTATSIAASNDISSGSRILVTGASSNAFDAGAQFKLINTSALRGWAAQLNTSQNLDFWHLDGSVVWGVKQTFNQDGGATFTGTINGTSASLNSIKLINGASNGYVLKSDASGNASWQPTTSSYKGIWDASTNTPTIADGTGATGDYYEVSTSGTQFGRSFTAGGRAIYNGSIWEPVGVSASVTSVNSYTGTVVLAKSDIGLSNVDNTSDANKPVSTATQTALNLKSNIASPSFTGPISNISAFNDTPNTGNSLSFFQPGITNGWSLNPNSSNNIDLQYWNGSAWSVKHAFSNTGGLAISGALSASNFSGSSSGTNTGDQTTITGNAGTATALQTARTISGTSFDGTSNITLNNTGITNGAGYITASALTPYAPLASPTFTGTPTLPTGTIATTQSPTDNSTKVATTAYADAAAAASVSTIVANTFTPTYTLVSGLDGATAFTAFYQRVNNIVNYTIAVIVDPTSTAACELGISLPVASDFNDGTGVSGVAQTETQSSISEIEIAPDVTNNRISLTFTPTVSTSFLVRLTGHYKIQ